MLRPFIVSLLLGLPTLLTMLLPGHGHAQSAGRAVRVKNRPTFMMTNPVSHIKLTFHEPALLETTGEVAAWRKITVQLPNDSFTIDAGVDSGYMIDTKSDNRQSWSPDGKYIALYQPHGLLEKKRFTSLSLTFLDLTYGEAVSFQSRSRQAVTQDNFRGWVAGKPHAIRKATDVPNQVEEALPDDELPNR